MSVKAICGHRIENDESGVSYATMSPGHPWKLEVGLICPACASRVATHENQFTDWESLEIQSHKEKHEPKL